MNNVLAFKKRNNLKEFELINNLKIDCFSDSLFDNTFVVFKSFNDIIYLIYSYKLKTLVLFNLITNQINSQIKKAHSNFISNIRHYPDNINKKDLIMSISTKDQNIKIWDIINFECLFNIKQIYYNGNIYSACLLNEKKEKYILSCNNNYPYNAEQIKVFNLKGEEIKEIYNFNENSFFIDNYYDNIFDINYIIVGNKGCIKSYDFNQNILYKNYCDNKDDQEYCSIIIKKRNKILHLISSCYDGNVRIWNFNTAELLNKIKVSSYNLCGICLKDKYLYIGTQDSLIIIVDLIKNEVIDYLVGHNNSVICIKNILHPKYGELLVSQGYLNDGIKFWKKNLILNKIP